MAIPENVFFRPFCGQKSAVLCSMVVNLSTVGSSCGAPSAGYVARLYLLCVDDVMYITEPDETLQVKIWPKPDAALYEMPLKPLTCTYSEVGNDDNAGGAYKISLGTVYAGATNGGIVRWAEAQRQKRYVAMFLTTTGETLLAGDIEHGMRVVVTRGAAQQNTVGVSISGMQPHRLYALQAIDPAVLFAEVGFDDDDYSSTHYFI